MCVVCGFVVAHVCVGGGGGAKFYTTNYIANVITEEPPNKGHVVDIDNANFAVLSVVERLSSFIYF